MGWNDWSVGIGQDGRGGTIRYREPGGHLDFWWEFGGGDAIAIVQVGTADEWRRDHAWAAERRDEILRRVADEVIRQRAPSCTADVDEQGWMTFRMRDTTSPLAAPAGPAAPPARGLADAASRYLEFSTRRSRIVGVFGAVVLGLAGLAWLGGSALTIRTIGSPQGPSMRGGGTVATLMTRLEPYVPTLDRNHGNDRHSIGLLLDDVERGRRRYVKLGEHRTGSNLSLSGLVAVDDRRVWARIPDLVGVDLASGRTWDEAAMERDPALAPPPEASSISALRGWSRDALDSARVALGDGDTLVLRPTEPHRDGTLEAFRLGARGRSAWTTDTGMQTLYDVLPGASHPAFVGEGPRVKGRSPEPILVVLDARSGRVTTRSLLMK